jgi:site-specific recombinase XerD
MLRHSYATEVRAKEGIEAASIMLGHSSIKTTEIYAEKSQKLRKEIARRIG